MPPLEPLFGACVRLRLASYVSFILVRSPNLRRLILSTLTLLSVDARDLEGKQGD